MQEAVHYYDLDFSEIFVFENLIVSRIKEGATVLLKHKVLLKNIIWIHFKNRDLVLISDRVNSFSIDPMIYRYMIELPTLKGVAVVIYDSSQFKSARFEKKFSAIPFEIFSDLDDAVIWADELLEAV